MEVRVASLSELPPEEPTKVVVDGHPYCLVRIDGDELHAIDDTCTHAEVSLSEGELDVDNRLIECWKHGSCFSLVDGHPDTLPATIPVRVYPVRLDGDDVLLETEPLPRVGGS